MRLTKKEIVMSLLLFAFSTQLACRAQDALNVMTEADIIRSSNLVRNTFLGTYEPSSKKIIDPQTGEKIGQISFAGKQVNVTFRATLSNPMELISNLNFTEASLQNLNFFDNGAKGHAGFVAATNGVKKFIFEAIHTYQREASLKPEDMTIIANGQSRGTAIGTLLAAYLKGTPEYSATPTYVLNYAPLPLFNIAARDECHHKLGQRNILNFICQEDAVLKLINKTMGENWKSSGTDIHFSAADYQEFKNRTGNYTHLSQKWLVMPLQLVQIDAKGWEGHMPETYLHSADAFKNYKQMHS